MKPPKPKPKSPKKPAPPKATNKPGSEAAKRKSKGLRRSLPVGG